MSLAECYGNVIQLAKTLSMPGVMSTVPPGAPVLVTGEIGYIASHTARQLLEDGYRVRGTVREEGKADWLYELFEGS